MVVEEESTFQKVHENQVACRKMWKRLYHRQAHANPDQKRTEPELGPVTFTQMCAGLIAAGHDFTEIQLQAHWANLIVYKEPSLRDPREEPRTAHAGDVYRSRIRPHPEITIEHVATLVPLPAPFQNPTFAADGFRHIPMLICLFHRKAQRLMITCKDIHTWFHIRFDQPGWQPRSQIR